MIVLVAEEGDMPRERRALWIEEKPAGGAAGGSAGKRQAKEGKTASNKKSKLPQVRTSAPDSQINTLRINMSCHSTHQVQESVSCPQPCCPDQHPRPAEPCWPQIHASQNLAPQVTTEFSPEVMEAVAAFDEQVSASVQEALEFLLQRPGWDPKNSLPCEAHFARSSGNGYCYCACTRVVSPPSGSSFRLFRMVGSPGLTGCMAQVGVSAWIFKRR